MDNKNIGVILHPSFPHSSSLSISKMSVQLLLIFPGSGCFSPPPLSPCWSRLNIYQFPYKFLCSFSCPSQSFSHTKARVIFFFFFLNSFISGCSGSSQRHTSFLQLRRVGSYSSCGVQAFCCSVFFCCETQTLGMWAQQLWLTGSRKQP